MPDHRNPPSEPARNRMEDTIPAYPVKGNQGVPQQSMQSQAYLGRPGPELPAGDQETAQDPQFSSQSAISTSNRLFQEPYQGSPSLDGPKTDLPSPNHGGYQVTALPSSFRTANETNNWNFQSETSPLEPSDRPRPEIASWNQRSYQQIAQRPPYLATPAAEFSNQNSQQVLQGPPSLNVAVSPLHFQNVQRNRKRQGSSIHLDNLQESDEDEDGEDEDESGEEQEAGNYDDESDGSEYSSGDENTFKRVEAGVLNHRNRIGLSTASRDGQDLTETLGLGFRLPSTARLRNSGDDQGHEKPRGPGGGVLRGPRKAAEPTGDIKLRLSQANEAYVKLDYVKAREIIGEIIRINAETQEAWLTLSTMDEDLGDMHSAVYFRVIAAALRPKDIQGWINTADYALAQTGESREYFLDIALYAYSSAVRASVDCVAGRLGKAEVKLERGTLPGAISDFKRIFKYSPHNLHVVRRLGFAYFENDEVEKAKQLYKSTFDYLRLPSTTAEETFDWTDVSVYITLLQNLGEFEAAIAEIKSLGRWLLGRESEIYFDSVTTNDCEWDTDDSRRIQLPNFIAGKFPLDYYGAGLPPELRAKMGLCRLKMGQEEEALHHLDYLILDAKADQGFINDHHELFHEVAKELMEASLYQNALSFYQWVKRVPDQATASIYIQIAKCFQANGLNFKAEECFQIALQKDEENVEARIELAKIYEATNQQEQATILINDAIAIRARHELQTAPPRKIRKRDRDRMEKREKAATPESSPLEPDPPMDQSFLSMKRPRASYRPRRLLDQAEQLKDQDFKVQALTNSYYTLRTEQEKMISGDETSTRRWMDAAKNLTDEFRGFKTFYPQEKYVRFNGYTGDGLTQAKASITSDLIEMADRLSQNLGVDVLNNKEANSSNIPNDYRGIPFKVWLDIFLEYALCLARQGQVKDSYVICQAAGDSITFCHSREYMFTINVAWLICAIIAGDEKSCIMIARELMKDYQFTSDTYRMFAAVARMCHAPVHYYNDNTTQKYVLRQIKTMDYALISQECRDKHFKDPNSKTYSCTDDQGQQIVNDDMDIVLLMVYGHILYASQSYIHALNYFFRAYAMDPENPMINLSVGLAYLQHALKRKAENRQHIILQGMTFLFTYYDLRKLSPNINERQEAHYNVARAYHMLGLNHLAIPYYTLILEEQTRNNMAEVSEDLVIDAAYNLQTIYSTAGNLELANAITEKWLIL